LLIVHCGFNAKFLIKQGGFSLRSKRWKLKSLNLQIAFLQKYLSYNWLANAIFELVNMESELIGVFFGTNAIEFFK